MAGDFLGSGGHFVHRRGHLIGAVELLWVPLAITAGDRFSSPLALSRSEALRCKRLKVSARKSRKVLAAIASLPSSS
jgi:hypothetical protein